MFLNLLEAGIIDTLSIDDEMPQISCVVEYHRKVLMVGQLLCVCVFSSHPFWTSMDVPAGVTQEEGHTGFLIHLPSAVRALIFVARRIQPFLSLVDVKSNFV